MSIIGSIRGPIGHGTRVSRTGIDKDNTIVWSSFICNDECATSLSHVQPSANLIKRCVALGLSITIQWKRSALTIKFVSTTGLRNHIKTLSQYFVETWKSVAYPVMSAEPGWKVSAVSSDIQRERKATHPIQVNRPTQPASRPWTRWRAPPRETRNLFESCRFTQSRFSKCRGK